MVNAAADGDAETLRISMDAKATVKVGNFSRGGKKRVRVKAGDHDFKPSATVTPVGILVPQSDDLFVACVTSKVTSDCLVDVLEQWWQSTRERFEQVKTLVINLDNGEDQSQPSHPVSQPARGLCPDLSAHGPLGLLSPVSQQIQCCRALLGDLRNPLEWGYFSRVSGHSTFLHI